MKNKTKNGLVSVIIPTYNSDKYLSDSIESALAQTYPHVEIIVIDDGSTDNTKKVVEPYLGIITYLYKENAGPASARNLGIAKSHGEYIAFLDADDYWLPEKLKIQIDFFQSNPQYGMIHANNLILETEREPYPAFIGESPPTGWVFKNLFLSNHINNLTVILKRECLDKVKGFDESKELIGIEDYELWLRISLFYEIGFLDKIVAVYRVHCDNISKESKDIQSQFYLTNKFGLLIKAMNNDFSGLISEKREILSYMRACNLLGNNKYETAKKDFMISTKRNYLRFHSALGILSCLLRTNILFKSRSSALKYKHYGYHLLSKGDEKTAKIYFRASIKYYPLQKLSFQVLLMR